MSNSQNLKQLFQSIFKNILVGGNLTTGDISQILNIFIVYQPNSFIPKGIPHNIPPSNTDKFVGRERELESLAQKLQRHHEVVIAAVEGMGGVGKTELAIQYSLLNLQLDTYSGGICWLRSREEDIGLQIINFARTDLDLNPPEDLELSDRVRWCWKRWREGDALIVFDDVKDYNNIKPYLPPQPSQFKVLITTRLKLDLPSSLYLAVLTESDALELLRELVGQEKVEQELEIAKELCQRLGYLPLALQLIGRYVEKRGISLAQELQRLEEEGLGHPSMDVAENNSNWTLNIKNGVQAAFELSWSELSESAQELGCVLSLFALAPIPWSLIESAAPKQDPETLEDARIELESLYLLQGGDTYQLHQLIRKFFVTKQTALANADEQKDNFCQALVKVAQSIPESPTIELIKIVKYAVPHLALVAENLIDTVRDEDLYGMFFGLNRFYSGQGLYAQAEPWCKQCISVVQTRLGSEHRSFVNSLNNLAVLYSSLGRYVEAEPLHLQSLKLYKRLLGEEHPDVATSLNNLAHLYSSQGRYAEAELLHLQALEMKKRLLGEDHPDVASSLNSLAYIYLSQGRYTEVESLYLQALEMRKRLLGEDHPDVATSLNNLAHLYLSQGRYKEAELIFLQSLEMRKRLLGEDHPDVASSFNNLACIYLSQGRYTKAELIFLQSLEMRKRLLGEDHPDVAMSLNNLAYIYLSQGRYTKAEPLYLEALELHKRLLGEEHPDVAMSLNNLAELYKSQGRHTEAETLYLQALGLYKRLLGEEHPDVAMSLNNLAGLYKSQGRHTEAETLYLQALKMRKRLLGEEHPSVAMSLNNLAELYSSQERYPQAEPFYLEALELYKRLLGEEHPDVATSLNNLAGLYDSQGRYTEAENLYIQSLDLRKRLLGEKHPDVAISLNNLAKLYDSQERYTEAEPLYLKALELAEKSLGIDHPNTNKIRANYERLKE
jgi:tetratricopeptide (TPR) repeat protein